MDDQNRNLILATALSFLVILVWFILFPPEEQAPNPQPTVPSEQALDAEEPLERPSVVSDRLDEIERQLAALDPSEKEEER